MQNLTTKNQFVYSDRKNTNYKAEEVINIFIPPTMSMVNTKEVFMVFDILLDSSQYKGCLCPSAGAYSLFRTITIMDGTGSTVLETLDSYAALQSLKYHIEKLDSTENLFQLHEGKPNKNVLHQKDSSLNQYCDPTKSEDYYTAVKVCLPLYLSGLLNPRRKYITPVVALRGLRIQFELHRWVDMFQASRAPLYKYDANSTDNALTGEYGGYGEDQAYSVQADALQNATQITLKKFNDITNNAAPVNRVLSDDVAEPAHLFCVGQSIIVQDTNGDDMEMVIQEVSINGDNRIVLTVPALAEAVDANAPLYIRTNQEFTGGITISNFKMNVGTVDPPQEYLQEVMGLVQSGKMRFDITSYTLFNKNISSGSLSNALVLNAMNQRAKSLLCIPILLGTDALKDTFQSVVQAGNELQSYSLKLYNNVIVPDRLVPLTPYNDGNFNAICQREQMLSAGAASWEVNNITDMHNHFFIGRRLAMQGYSYNCLGMIELDVNYKANDALLMQCFLVHKRSINVSDVSVNVSY